MCSFASLVLSARTQHCTFAALTLANHGVQTFGFIQYTASSLHYQVKEVQIMYHHHTGILMACVYLFCSVVQGALVFASGNWSIS